MPDLYRACRRPAPRSCRFLALLPLLVLSLPGQAEVVFKGLSRTTEKGVRATGGRAGGPRADPEARERPPRGPLRQLVGRLLGLALGRKPTELKRAVGS